MGSCLSVKRTHIQPLEEPIVTLYYPFPNPNGNQTAVVLAPTHYYNSINRTVPNPFNIRNSIIS